MFGKISFTYTIALFILSASPKHYTNPQKCISKLKSTQQQKHFVKLRKLAYKCSKKYTDNSELYFLRGLFDIELKDYPKAIKSLSKSIELKQTQVSGYQLLLRAYLLNKSKTKSFKWLIKKYVQQFHKHPNTLLKFVDLFVEFNYLKASFFYLKYLIDQKCKSPWLYLLKLGELHFVAQDYDEALQFFESSLRQNPKSSYTMVCLAKTWLAKKNYKFALSYFQHAKTLGVDKSLKQVIETDLKAINKIQSQSK